MAHAVKNLCASQETRVQSLGREDPLEKGMATHSSILAWRIPWTRSLVGYSPWALRESDRAERLNNDSGPGSAFIVLKRADRGRDAS